MYYIEAILNYSGSSGPLQHLLFRNARLIAVFMGNTILGHHELVRAEGTCIDSNDNGNHDGIGADGRNDSTERLGILNLPRMYDGCDANSLDNGECKRGL